MRVTVVCSSVRVRRAIMRVTVRHVWQKAMSRTKLLRVVRCFKLVSPGWGSRVEATWGNACADVVGCQARHHHTQYLATSSLSAYSQHQSIFLEALLAAAVFVVVVARPRVISSNASLGLAETGSWLHLRIWYIPFSCIFISYSGNLDGRLPSYRSVPGDALQACPHRYDLLLFCGGEQFVCSEEG